MSDFFSLVKVEIDFHVPINFSQFLNGTYCPDDPDTTAPPKDDVGHEEKNIRKKFVILTQLVSMTVYHNHLRERQMN